MGTSSGQMWDGRSNMTMQSDSQRKMEGGKGEEEDADHKTMTEKRQATRTQYLFVHERDIAHKLSASLGCKQVLQNKLTFLNIFYYSF